MALPQHRMADGKLSVKPHFPVPSQGWRLDQLLGRKNLNMGLTGPCPAPSFDRLALVLLLQVSNSVCIQRWREQAETRHSADSLHSLKPLASSRVGTLRDMGFSSACRRPCTARSAPFSRCLPGVVLWQPAREQGADSAHMGGARGACAHSTWSSGCWCPSDRVSV